MTLNRFCYTALILPAVALCSAALAGCHPVLETDPSEMVLLKLVPSISSAEEEAVTRCSGQLCSEDGILTVSVEAAPMEEIPVKSVAINSLKACGSYRLYGYQYDNWSSSVIPNLASGTLVSTSSNTATFYRWGAAYKRFFAYAPSTGGGVSAVQPEGVGGPSLFVESSTDIAEQCDIIVADSGQQSFSDATGSVSLPFRHILSSIKFCFDVGKMPGSSWEITSLTLKGVASNGVYCCASREWGSVGGSSDMVVEWVHKFGFMDILSINPVYVNADSPLFLLPQSLSGARLEIEAEVGGVHKVVGCNFGASSRLKAGFAYTIKINMKGY